MRLIDADKLIEICDKGWRLGSAINTKIYHTVNASDIRNQPTVKAITIEWLHSIMERQLIFAMNSEMEGTTTVKDGVIHCVSGALACQVLANVIELWEKENGKEKS